MIRNCLVCDAPLRPTRKELYCSAEHKFKHSLRLLEAAATPHHGINPVEIEQESDAVKGSNEERQPPFYVSAQVDRKVQLSYIGGARRLPPVTDL